uniref:4-hydroxy-7-methoxy-3-oxo-3,4-dihydro-2H-1,4-benzoxazin-2-yl glucosidebeta-D-glucosidase n=1 Tax=Aegilops tauschii subsp. strangulata TaxID=200361 RepID=A0A453C6R3_AEGTS
MLGFRNGAPIGPETGLPWLYVYPQGLRDLLLYVKEKYGNPTIYITENGLGETTTNTSLPLAEALKDDARIEYHHMHLVALLSAIRSDNSNSVNNLQILYLSDSGLIACVCQGRGKREGVLRMVAAGQLRVGNWVHGALRVTLRGL